MKKVFKNLLIASVGIFGMAVLSLGQTFASGCFHDRINVVDKAGYITQGSNVRNVACMDGSTKIATLAQGTKVRIIGQTAWTKIVMPDGRVGWVGNNYVAETNDRTNVPAHPSNHKVDSYCDTTYPTKCPTPVKPGQMPDWYYIDDSQAYSNYQPAPQPTPAPEPVYVTPEPTQIQLTDTGKLSLDNMAAAFVKKIEAKYPNDLDAQVAHMETVVTGLGIFKTKAYKIAQLVDYLQAKIDEHLAMKKLEQLLDV